MSATRPTIADVIAAAAQPGHAHRKAVLGVASAWLVAAAKAHGLDVEGFQHTLEIAAVRHMRSKHGNGVAEARRGQIGITDSDFLSIPEMLTVPDKVVFGPKNRRKQPLIAFIKKFPSGTTVFFTEFRIGRRELAALSMRRYPATIDVNTIAGTLDPNGQTDDGDKLYIVDFPGNVTVTESQNSGNHPATIDANGNPDLDGQADGGATPKIPPSPAPVTPPPAWRRAAKFLPPILGILVLAGIIFGLHGALSRIGPRDVLNALAATPGAALANAGLLLAASFCVMLVYDVPGILFAAKLSTFPKLKFRRIALASFCAYALSHVLGAPALSAAAIRLRLYAQWQVPPAGIARIIALSGTAFMLGAATLVGGLLILHPLSLPLFGASLSAAALRGIGVLLIAAILAYVFLAQTREALALFGRTLPLPGRLIAGAQIIMACTDTFIACTILYAVLPAAPGLSLAHVLAIYLAAFAAGLVSSLPAGLGVFDTLLLLGLAPYMPTAAAIGAILLFRVIYFLSPACVAGLIFAAHEIFLTTKGQKE